MILVNTVWEKGILAEKRLRQGNSRSGSDLAVPEFAPGRT
jgi:hypothetical protein